MELDHLRRRHRRIRTSLVRAVWRWGGPVVGFAVIPWLGYTMVLRTDLFELTQLRISDTSHVRSQDIKAIFEPALHQNLLILDLEPLMREVMDHPWVREVRIRKVLPGTLMIHIQERMPVVMVESRGGLRWVDEEGMVLGSVNLQAHHLKPLPQMIGIPLNGLLRRDPEQLRRFRAGLTLVELIHRQPKPGLGNRNFEGSLVLDLSHGDKDPRLHLDGYTLRFGEGDYEQKWKSFLAIHEDLKARDLAPEEIDLRFIDQVIVKTF